MGNSFKLNRTRLASQATSLTMIGSILFGMPISSFAGLPTAGDSAQKVPTVKVVCDALRAAADGKLVDMSGKPLTFTTNECMSLPRRQRDDMAKCQASAADLLKAGETADTLCSREQASLNAGAATFCALRTINKSNQSVTYCDAYDSANRAQTGAMVLFGLDAAAAGVCWAEYKLLKDQLNFYIKSQNYSLVPKEKGLCAGASMAAGLGELVQSAFVLFGGTHSTGNIKIDGDNNATEKKRNLSQVAEVAMSAGLSQAAIRQGVCQYWPEKFPGICGKKMENFKKNVVAAENNYNGSAETFSAANTELQNAKSRMTEAKKQETAAEEVEQRAKTRVMEAQTHVDQTECSSSCSAETVAAHEVAVKKLDVEKAALRDAHTSFVAAKTTQQIATDDVQAAATTVATVQGATQAAESKFNQSGADLVNARMQARIKLAYSSALIFSALSVMRGTTLALAATTKTKAKDILQSMFASGNGVTNFGASGFGSGGTNVYANNAGGAYSSTGGASQMNQSSAIAAGSPEAFMLPPGATHTPEIQKIAAQISPAKAEEAASGGAAGMGNLISSIAGGMGAKSDPGEIHTALSTMFTNLPKDSGAGYGGSAGRGLASKGGDTNVDLNLKGLFGGGGEKEDHSAATPDMAYRGPASDDIWHSQNPKGNNLFQIVSDRYDNTQRRQELAP